MPCGRGASSVARHRGGRHGGGRCDVDVGGASSAAASANRGVAQPPSAARSSSSAGTRRTAAASRRVDAYSPARDAWRRLPDLPVGVHHATAVGADGSAVRPRRVHGRGRDPAQSVFVLERGAGARLPRMPFPRAAAGAGVAGGRIVVAGGDRRGPPARAERARVRPRARRAGRSSPARRRASTSASTSFAGIVYAVGGRTAGLDTNLLHFESFRPGDRGGGGSSPCPDRARRNRRRRRSPGRSCPSAARSPEGRSRRCSRTASRRGAGCSFRTCRARDTASASPRSAEQRLRDRRRARARADGQLRERSALASRPSADARRRHAMMSRREPEAHSRVRRNRLPRLGAAARPAHGRRGRAGGARRRLPRWNGLAVAGRTDTGVHATGQVASVDVEGGPPPERAAEALNCGLPDDVAVSEAAEAAPTASTRASPHGRGRTGTGPHGAAVSARRAPSAPVVASRRRTRHSRLPPRFSPESTTSARSRRPRRSTRCSSGTSSPPAGRSETPASTSRSPPTASCGTWCERSWARCSSRARKHPSRIERLLDGRPRAEAGLDGAAARSVPRAGRLLTAATIARWPAPCASASSSSTSTAR